MKQKILFYLFLLIGMISLNSCSKDDDEPLTPEQQLPPITTTGANTFGCLIDGVLFVPRNGTDVNDYAMFFWGGYPSSTDYYEIDIRDYKSEHTASLLIHLQSVHQQGTGQYNVKESNGFSNIDGNNHTYMHCRIWRPNINNYQWYLSFNNSGVVNITKYDFINHIISGTFSGKVRNYYLPHDTIQITNGRFDIDWDTNLDANFP